MDRIATITMAKCSVLQKNFNIRWEQQSSKGWKATWAFKIPDKGKFRPGTGSNVSTELNGELFLEEYPGCPYCREHELVLCLNCHQLYCGDWHTKKTIRCPWCGVVGSIIKKSMDESVSTSRDA
jgi:hypothetical protein